MGFKTLLVHVEGTPDSDLRIRVAVDLAYDLSAKLIGVGGRTPIYLEAENLGGIYPMYPGGAATQAIIEQEDTRLEVAEARFHRLAGALGAGAVWRCVKDEPDQVLEHYSAGADLIVASTNRGPHVSTVDPGELALTAGIPVLALPTDLMGLRRKRIVVAWKNTREARRAVADALPLLQKAKQVVIVQVYTEERLDGEDGSLQAVVDRLSGHGVNTTAETILKGSSDDATRLITYAEDNLADLIVCGAYGHSRLREWSFGGMTHGLLRHSSLPILLSH